MLEAIIIGAGQAGLSMSYHLQQEQVRHLVLEKGVVAESWRNQRWDSLTLNTPNKMNLLPGMEALPAQPGGFALASDFADQLSRYVQRYDLPVRQYTEVLELTKLPDSAVFRVTIRQGDQLIICESRQVIIATGTQNQPFIPGFAANMPPETEQFHSSEYRSPGKLREGAVLIVGSGQSGAQIARELVDYGRKVYLSASRTGWIPRSYRGRDIEDWLVLSGFYDDLPEQSTLQLIKGSPQPLIANEGCLPPLLHLQNEGVTLLGKTTRIQEGVMHFNELTAGHLQFGNDYCQAITGMIDHFIASAGLTCDDFILSFPAFPLRSQLTRLDPVQAGISTVIWATGFSGSFDYIRLPVWQQAGKLRHQNGISDIPGLYFAGLPWLRKRKSGIIYGVAEDALFLSEQVMARRKLVSSL
jgi:putative flavoprotein involved in K+ transport